MKKIKALLNYFTKGELVLWFVSVVLIIISYFIFSKESGLMLAASLIGATSLIFNAKGNPFGQLLIVIFSILYSIISFSFAYYGEMITYLGMTAPMAIVAFISWVKNPYDNKSSEVRVNRLKLKEIAFMIILTLIVTVVFYYLLSVFHTANLIPSTLSVATSFLAAYLTFRRSVFYAVFYALNDLVLIVLWILAAIYDISYLSVVICFAVFLINDIYGFISWSKMKKRQAAEQGEK